MYFCYVDESGLPDKLPITPSKVMPVFVLGGVIFRKELLAGVTTDFLNLKSKFFKKATGGSRFLDRILFEVKGAELRRNFRTKGRNVRRHILGFLGELLQLIEKHDGKVIGRALIKKPGEPVNRHSVYTSYVQHICNYFHTFLDEEDGLGAVIADSRVKQDNARVAHSIFTQKFKHNDNYSRLAELPVFAHSDNHAGLQIADIVCSALIFPMAAHAFCAGQVPGNPHLDPKFAQIRNSFGHMLRTLQYRFVDMTGRRRGGITVADMIAGRPGGMLFQD